MVIKDDTSLDDIAEAIQALATNIDQRFDHVNQRFDHVDRRFDHVEGRLDNLEKGQREMRDWLERIDSRLSGVESDIKEIYDRIVVLEKRFPDLKEQEVRELEEKLAVIITWAQEVSRKTGVVLPKL